jgi:hypothetical protein
MPWPGPSVAKLEKIMEFRIIDSLCHWGPSMTLGSNATTNNILKQMKEAGVERAVVLPFASTAARSGEINVRILNEAGRVREFVPFFHIREDLFLVAEGYSGARWERMRAVRDMPSNYAVLEDPETYNLMDTIAGTGRPLIIEEDLRFTEKFANMARSIPLIVPFLGSNGGDPNDFLTAFKDRANIYFNTAMSEKETLVKFIDTVGPNRLLFASNAPFGSMRFEVSKILSLHITDEDKQRVLAGNIERLANIKPL